MIVFPIAKINIGLSVTSKRQDGFHNIETIFYPVSLCDALEFVISDKPEKKDILAVTGINTGIPPEDNILIRTIALLREITDLPFLKIHLHKAIPVGAGLGGGSSDAACLMKSVNRHFGINLDNQSLKTMALELGSDCPFFIDGKPSIASGRGEIMTPVELNLSGFYLVILNPGVGISTAEAYNNCKPQIPSASLTELFKLPVYEWKNVIVNDFEEFAFSKHPVIGEVKEDLYRTGAIFSLMSGSGSSVYGIFKNKPELPHRLRKFVIWENQL
jgi:4-diphosphocytidyl-2-C-methyl-D-erythritol kinase